MRILIVDDDDDFISIAGQRWLYEHQVTYVSTLSEARELLKAGRANFQLRRSGD